MNDSGGQSGAQTLKALHLEALPARKFCDPLERPLAVKRASLPMIFERNSERMRYARYRAQKLFVGSGVVEAWLQDCHRPKTQDVGHVLDRPRRQFPHCTPLQPHQRQIHRLLGVPCRMSSTIMSRTHKGVTHPHA